MFKKIPINSIYNCIVIILIVVAVAIRGGATFRWMLPQKEFSYSLKDIQVAYKDAAKVKLKSEGTISILDNNNNKITNALFSGDFNAEFQGYAGKIPVLIYFDNKHVVSRVQLLKNDESPEYITYITEKGLLNTWSNMPIDTLLINKYVDAISGATYSSNAIIKTVNKTLGGYLSVQAQYQKNDINGLLKSVLTLILILLSLSMLLKKWFRKYYLYYLILIVMVSGFWFKQMLSLETIHTWIMKGMPWQSNWELITVLIIAIAVALLGHKNYYCTYLCPMGAIQMIASKISPLKKKGLQLKISKVSLRSVYLTFIWVSLIFGYTVPLSDMEPFKAFSFTVASDIMLIAGVVIVLMSFIFNRPWCQLCPTGCLLNSVPSLKSKKQNHAK
ncbi:FMN-binding protein [Plebeiibacterium marinum]|uniref:FMN-binding protein n=1 Tax=Plebeiibacterium marinum TaxID=2992111 RepID=A0AAE3MGW0_9BACT|nr:FMN-binding protein [Plebeiobacterium marinum]MCW3806807.1 FMN-binding protein [Plebeiobacterium marinum]